MLSALEKKDVEELSRLRTLHQQNILKLTTQIREQEIDSAQESIFSLERNRDAVEYRRDYYGALVKEGLIPWEKRQAEARHASSIIRGTQATLGFLASVTHLIPQLGSPFAMKYGGLETGYSLSNVAAASEALAVLSENVAASAGLEANFQRREHEWDHQFELADKELKQIEKQLEAARIRKEIAEQSLEIHKRDMKQLKEVYDFYGDKFSNFGLYTWFSTTLQRLYREAYNSAYSMAKLTEQAFHFERGDNSEILIGASYWDASKAGLLAGEQLLIDLQNMEKRFIETNYRSLEINQSFSLTQINPIALIQLKEHGECTFDIHEIFFDLLYPGHYKRRIKSVRLTMPCITGPYTNVSATLTLTSSKIRKEPDLAANPITLLPSRTASIATSTAQNDGGVFELSFRDERYMPFEGAGAISTWKLTLPKNFRQFDYQTINDVVIHISYTAENDAALGEQVERFNAANEGAIQSFLKNNSLYRIISFRQEFSNEFNRILHSPVGSAVKIKLMNKHFPIFMKGMSLKINKAMLILRPAKRQTVGVFKISINGTAYNGFAVDQQMGGLPAKPLGGLFAGFVLDYELTIIIQDSGNLSSIAPVPGDNSALDSEKLEDIYLYLEYGIN